jgi:hypothetical protein
VIQRQAILLQLLKVSKVDTMSGGCWLDRVMKSLLEAKVTDPSYRGDIRVRDGEGTQGDRDRRQGTRGLTAM